MRLFPRRSPKSGWRPSTLEIAGTTDVTLGCGDCPRRTTVTLQGVGELALSMEPLVPLKVVTHTDGSAAQFRYKVSVPVGINQRPCTEAPGDCPYGDSVTEQAASLKASPTALALEVDPLTVRYSPDSTGPGA